MDSVIADILHLKGSEFEDPDIPIGSIALDVSPDNKIYYHALFADSCLQDGVFTLAGYYGKILVPKLVGIQISTNLNITGTIASPTNIENRGNISLDVTRESHLELCIMGEGNLIINGRVEHKENGTIYPYGKDFDGFTNAYSILPKHKRKDDGFYNMHVCLYYNLLNICNDGADISLRYHGIHRYDQQAIARQDNTATILRLKREMEHAASIEDFAKAARVQKEIRELEEHTGEAFGKEKIYRTGR